MARHLFSLNLGIIWIDTLKAANEFLMIVAKNTVVYIAFTITDNNSNILDKTQCPLPVIIGQNHMLPVIESALIGHSANACITLTIDPHEGFGMVNAARIITVPLNQLPDPNSPINTEVILPMDTNTGTQPLYGRIIARSTNTAQIDFNHPLAGKQLHYTITICDIRNQTPEEIDTGLLADWAHLD